MQVEAKLAIDEMVEEKVDAIVDVQTKDILKGIIQECFHKETFDKAYP